MQTSQTNRTARQMWMTHVQVRSYTEVGDTDIQQTTPTSSSVMGSRRGGASTGWRPNESTTSTIWRAASSRLIVFCATAVRILYVVLSICSAAFPGILVYIILALVMPPEE